MEKKSDQHREVLSSLQQEYQRAQGLAVGKVWPADGMDAHAHREKEKHWIQPQSFATHPTMTP